MKKLQRRIWEILQVAQAGDRASALADWFLLTLIVLNVAAVIVESIPQAAARAETAFYRFEVFSVAVFTIEFSCRLFACVSDSRFGHPFAGRLKFVFRPMTLIDLLAILPFYLPLIGVDLRFMRICRQPRQRLVLQ